MARKVRWEGVLKGHRVRVYASRTAYEVLTGDDDISDPKADVWEYPKTGTPEMWAEQHAAQNLKETPDAAT